MPTSINNKVLLFHLLIAALALAIGWLIAPGLNIHSTQKNSMNHIDAFRNWGNVFTILWVNLKVGFLLSVLGYFTAGLCSVFILIWNGMLLKLSISATLSHHLNMSIPDLIIQYFPHAFTELLALMLFASIGLNGYSFFKSLYRKTPFTLPIKAAARIFIIASGLLFLSSIIEVYV